MMKILHFYQWLTTLIFTLYLIPHIRGIREELVVSNIQDGFGDLDKPVGKNLKRVVNMINFDINIFKLPYPHIVIITLMQYFQLGTSNTIRS